MRVTSNKSILTNLNELVKAEIEKLKMIRYEKTEDGRYRAIRRDPKVDLTINEVTRHIINLTLHSLVTAPILLLLWINN